MTSNRARDRADRLGTNTSEWGIDRRYEDGLQNRHDVSEDTVRKLMRAMRSEGERPPVPDLQILREGERKPLLPDAEVVLEDGTILNPAHTEQLPLGYHRLRNVRSGKETRLIVTPPHCYLPEGFRAWGWSVQLYALRSKGSWGIGDFEDLKQLCTWSSDVLNAGIIMTNPLSAATPGKTQEPSPYYPGTRLYRNPLYLRVEEVPGAEAVSGLHEMSKRGRALSERPLVERDLIYQLKINALEQIWSHVRDRVRLDEFRASEGQNLRRYASFCAIAEEHGQNWNEWPPALQHPGAPEVAEYYCRHAERVHFHEWLQFLLDKQLSRASARHTVMQDLPIGVDPAGADAWIWQDILAKDVTVGAPPDPFSETGQNWGLPPFVPHKLRATGYDAFAQTVRSAMRYSAGLRIDHAMGLFRLFWIPAGESPKSGTYVRYAADEMLSILALESVRARAFVVGEDLGTVEPGVREKLADRRVLSYKVLWFEEGPPAKYANMALASVSTHDLPTIAGAWTGADVEEQKKAGVKPNEEGLAQNRDHLARICGVDPDAPVSEVIIRAHEALAQAPCTVILASLDDALGFERRPNLPGTTNDQRPNWSIPLPKTLEQIQADPQVLRVATLMRNAVMQHKAEAVPQIT